MLQPRTSPALRSCGFGTSLNWASTLSWCKIPLCLTLPGAPTLTTSTYHALANPNYTCGLQRVLLCAKSLCSTQQELKRKKYSLMSRLSAKLGGILTVRTLLAWTRPLLWCLCTLKSSSMSCLLKRATSKAWPCRQLWLMTACKRGLTCSPDLEILVLKSDWWLYLL